MKATSYNRAKGNKMKTTLTLITIITSLFFSACANNNRAEYWNPRRAANAYNPLQEQSARWAVDQLQKTIKQAAVEGSRMADRPSPSSQRFKHDIKPMDKISDAILALKPVTFHYKSDGTNTPQFGLVAEDVAKVNPDLVVRDDKGEIYSVRYDAVNAMLLNEFLKEHRKVEELEKQVKALTAGQAERSNYPLSQ
jgi:hypothetical protein